MYVLNCLMKSTRDLDGEIDKKICIVVSSLCFIHLKT